MRNQEWRSLGTQQGQEGGDKSSCCCCAFRASTGIRARGECTNATQVLVVEGKSLTPLRCSAVRHAVHSTLACHATWQCVTQPSSMSCEPAACHAGLKRRVCAHLRCARLKVRRPPLSAGRWACQAHRHDERCDRNRQRRRQEGNLTVGIHWQSPPTSLPKMTCR